MATLLASSSPRAEPSNGTEGRAGSVDSGAACTATEGMARASCSAPPACDEAPHVPPSALRRSAAVVAGLVPGLLVHGAGSFVLGRPCTAQRLLAAEGLGIGLLAIGGGAIVLSGAARDIVGPAAALSIAGLGLFGISALADIYSVTAPEGGWGRPPTGVPRWETSLGYRYVYDPQFSYRHFLVDRIDFRSGRWRLSPSVWMSSEDANERMRLVTAFRPWGPTPNERARDGSFLDAELALTHHRFARESFAITTVEAFAFGRLDLARVDAGLSGSFADFGAGAATQVYDWESDAGARQSTTLLLSRFGFGAYLGSQAPSGGYVLAYYDHRHDGYAGGLLNLGVGSGVAGHFGLESVYYFDDHYGLELEAQFGSAWVTGLSARFRAGGTR
jgi:hypothetical protein